MVLKNIKFFDNREQLKEIETPAGTDTHKPIDHFESADQVARLIVEQGYDILKESHEVTEEGARVFSRFNVAGLDDGYQFFVGHRNSHDKKFARGTTIGTEIECCSNLMFQGEFMVTDRHTQKLKDNFDKEVADNISAILRQFEAVHQRMDRMKHTEISDRQANAIIFECFRDKVLPGSKIERLIKEYNYPSHDEFKGRTLYSLENAFTHFLKDNRSVMLFEASKRLKNIMDKHIGILSDYRFLEIMESMHDLNEIKDYVVNRYNSMAN